jgi:hypothetical protein
MTKKRATRSIRLVGPLALLTVAAAVWSGTGAAAAVTAPDPASHRPAPKPAGVFEDQAFTLAKNWDFGTSGNIGNNTALATEFQFHDQFGTIMNGTNYGSKIVAPTAATALPGQPAEDPANPVRQYTAGSMKTLLIPLGGATTVTPTQHNVGNGSIQAKWTLPNGGSLLGQDILWETRVRMVTPPYFWFALWTSGNAWDCGAEMDVVESFGFDNGGGFTNYDGRLWHSNSVCGSDAINYSSWPDGMAAGGVTNFDATQYHTWQWLYRKDNTFSVYMDGHEVQHGTINWTVHGTAGGTPINMSFLIDAGWGHTQVASVNHSLPASTLSGKYYEFDYSRVYLQP